METDITQSWKRKLYSIISRRKSNEPNAEGNKLARVLGLLDLTALGVGSTLGLGVYVLAGAVAANDAGPAVTISFLIAAIASAFAGLCYAEFASRVPRAGSAYVYCYVTIGEFCAFFIGWNLILEYAIGTASVAKGLSNYLDILCDNAMQKTFAKMFPMNVSFLASYPDLFASGLVVLLSILLAWGVKESANVNGVLTIMNLLTVAIVIICGIFKANPNYWIIRKSEIPADIRGGEGGFLPFGWAGVWAGAAKCFFAFVGFDVIATTGEEAKNPKRNIPLAIVTSLLIIFISYFGVASVITMMVPYYEQNQDAPLPAAFKAVGLAPVMWIVTTGAMCALFASLLGAIFPLPRVLYAMAEDGLLFKCFSNVNSRTQTPVLATLVSGVLSGAVAGMFNLNQLIDMMSIGTLLAYTIVAFCILILRYEGDTESVKQSSTLFENSTEKSSASINRLMHILKLTFNLRGSKYPSACTQKIATRYVLAFCLFSSLTCFTFIYGDYIIPNDTITLYLNIILGMLTIVSLVILCRQPQTSTMIPFKVPFVPLIPCCSIMMNAYLMLKLDIHTWIRFIVWLILGFIVYLFYSIDHSEQGKRNNQKRQERQGVNGIKSDIDVK